MMCTHWHQMLGLLQQPQGRLKLQPSTAMHTQTAKLLPCEMFYTAARHIHARPSKRRRRHAGSNTYLSNRVTFPAEGSRQQTKRGMLVHAFFGEDSR